MYRIYDKTEAIRSLQRYLTVAGNPDIFIMPSGVYDENTKLSVLDFQAKNNLTSTGIVDYETFTAIYKSYLKLTEAEILNKRFDSFIQFPIYPGKISDGMSHINRMMRNILNYYGITNRLNESNFYSEESTLAVKTLRQIYLLEDRRNIDEELYLRMTKDHESIGKFKTI